MHQSRSKGELAAKNTRYSIGARWWDLSVDAMLVFHCLSSLPEPVSIPVKVERSGTIFRVFMIKEIEIKEIKLWNGHLHLMGPFQVVLFIRTTFLILFLLSSACTSSINESLH